MDHGNHGDIPSGVINPWLHRYTPCRKLWENPGNSIMKGWTTIGNAIGKPKGRDGLNEICIGFTLRSSYTMSHMYVGNWTIEIGDFPNELPPHHWIGDLLASHGPLPEGM